MDKKKIILAIIILVLDVAGTVYVQYNRKLHVDQSNSTLQQVNREYGHYANNSVSYVYEKIVG